MRRVASVLIAAGLWATAVALPARADPNDPQLNALFHQLFEATDALGTAKVLAAAIKRAGDVDLVLTATESTDGYTGTVPAQVGELLGWPSLTFARAVDIADGKIKIERQTEKG